MAQVDIAGLRKRLGGGETPISQTELAKLLGVNQATVCRWERRQGEPTRLALLLIEQLDGDVAVKAGGDA